MVNMKFKIGDKVRITGSYADATDHLDGKIGEVVAVDVKDIEVKVKGEKYTWLVWNHNAELVTEPPKDKIIITTDGKITAATLYGEMGTKKTATARCAPEDKFDFFTGAELALKRLIGKEDVDMKKLEKPKYYNGKVVCIKSEFTRDFTVGKVYTFEDGVVKDNRGASRYVGHRIVDPTEIKGTWEFVPFVEDDDKPLTVEEIKAMDGQKVWLVSLDENKNPYSNNRLGGWHTVDAKNDKLIDAKDDFFYIHDSNTTFGYLAYRTAPRK